MGDGVELLPCPFCGGEELGVSSASNNIIHYMCLTCEGSSGYAVGDTESLAVWDKARSLWNTRADLHQKALDSIEAEVTKAREEGRRAGLEEAAKACDRIAGETRMGYSDERRRGAGMCAANIRVLAQTSTTPEGEGEE